MSNLVKKFQTLYVLSVVLTVLIPTSLDSIVLVLTVGLSAPLFLAAPTFLIYATPLMFADKFIQGGVEKRRVLAVAFAAIAMIAILPGVNSNWAANAFAERMSAADIDLAMRQRPQNIELISPPSYHAGRRTVVEEAPCEETCLALLLGSEVTSVTVKVLNTGLDVVHSVGYHLENRKSCPSIKLSSKRLLAYSNWAARLGKCIIPTVGAEAPGNAVKVSVLTARHRKSYLKGVTVKWGQMVSRVEISDPVQPLDQQLRFMQTLSNMRKVRVPLYIELDMYELRMDMQIARTKLSTNEMNLDEILRTRLGYKLMPPDFDSNQQ